MRFRHFMTLDLPMVFDEEALTDRLASLLAFCVEQGYITEEDMLARLVFFVRIFEDQFTIFSLYVRSAPSTEGKQSAKAEGSPQDQNQGGLTDPPFGNEPTPFNPDVLRDAVTQQFSLARAVKAARKERK